MADTGIEVVRHYHQTTKHHFQRYARSLGYLDWATQPDPFRTYAGVPTVALDRSGEVSAPTWDALHLHGIEPRPVTHASISTFFRYSMAISAWKELGASRWALRVNPSSGNLHPTEVYAIAGVLGEAPADQPAVYHYVSSSHALESRCPLPVEVWRELAGELAGESDRQTGDTGLLVGLTSVLWREAWKYGERAFRYCQHDTGHAIAALDFAAALHGWELRLLPGWSSRAVATLLGVDREEDRAGAEAEEVEVMAAVRPRGSTAAPPAVAPPAAVEMLGRGMWRGRPNVLSSDHYEWSIIDEVATATIRPGASDPDAADGIDGIDEAVAVVDGAVGDGEPRMAEEARQAADAPQLILQRRSAVHMDGRSPATLSAFVRMMDRTLPARRLPFAAQFWRPCIDLAVFVHRVEGLRRGLYMLVREPARLERLRDATRPTFEWQHPAEVPADLPLFLLSAGDCTDLAASLSCQQEIAGGGFFSLGMIADFDRSLERHGPWFYRNLFWESGMIGQVLYLEAEAAGARGTGIGCYFDDPVHELLGIADTSFQSLYHFTVGMPVEDRRLTTLAAYDDDA